MLVAILPDDMFLLEFAKTIRVKSFLRGIFQWASFIEESATF
jgi:hypothetical protein